MAELPVPKGGETELESPGADELSEVATAERLVLETGAEVDPVMIVDPLTKRSCWRSTETGSPSMETA